MRKILILLENFYPAYKGGGPIQSITNLILSIENEHDVYVITSAYDLQSKVIMQNIAQNTWNTVLLPQSKKNIKVWYGEKNKFRYKIFRQLLKEIKPHILYMNGIYSYNLFLLPLFVAKNLYPKPKIVICPRGMLQKGALADKSFKKKAYLKFLKFSGLVDKTVWHATNVEEKDDVLRHFVANEVVIAINIPKKPVNEIKFIEKVAGTLQLIYLSLIAEKKNLLFLLQLIKATKNISLDIYGPVKDQKYWKECQQLINLMTDKVEYHGDVTPGEVQNAFTKYHALAILTKGENFGHALYESLSSGRPVITSNFTPWNNLEENKAGWNLNISDFSACIIQLNKVKELEQSEFGEFCIGGYKLAKEYFISSNNLDNYRKLFSISSGKTT